MASECPVAAPIEASSLVGLIAAAAIPLFGLGSGATPVTVAGVLVEVPVMLSAVRIVTGRRGWYEARAA
jgi:ACR3 family arsenite transporter